MRRVHLLAAAVAMLAIAACTKQAPPRDPGSIAEPWHVHVVQAGEFPARIAWRYGVLVDDLLAANRLASGSDLSPGQRLVIPGVLAPPPAPSEGTAPVEPPWFQPRSTWTAAEIDLGNIDPMGTPFRITVHHTAMPGDTWMAPRELLQRIETEHRRPGRGKPAWACIGYHYLIDRAGTVWEGRPLQYQGAHAGDREKNRGNIGVCLFGNFEDRPVPEAQLAALRRVLDRLRAQHRIPRTQILGHKEAFPNHTACPGRFLEPHVTAYRNAR